MEWNKECGNCCRTQTFEKDVSNIVAYEMIQRRNSVKCKIISIEYYSTLLYIVMQFVLRSKKEKNDEMSLTRSQTLTNLGEGRYRCGDESTQALRESQREGERDTRD